MKCAVRTLDELLFTHVSYTSESTMRRSHALNGTLKRSTMVRVKVKMRAELCWSLKKVASVLSVHFPSLGSSRLSEAPGRVCHNSLLDRRNTLRPGRRALQSRRGDCRVPCGACNPPPPPMRPPHHRGGAPKRTRPAYATLGMRLSIQDACSTPEGVLRALTT